MIKIRDKYDYLKLGSRANVHTEIRTDLYQQLRILSIQHKEQLPKIFDMLIEMILEDKDLQNKLFIKVKNY